MTPQEAYGVFNTELMPAMQKLTAGNDYDGFFRFIEEASATHADSPLLQSLLGSKRSLAHYHLGHYPEALQAAYSARDKVASGPFDTKPMVIALDDANNMIAESLERNDRRAEGIDFHLKSAEWLAMLPESLAEPEKEALHRSNASRMLNAEGHFADAREQALRALGLREPLGNKFQISTSYKNLGDINVAEVMASKTMATEVKTLLLAQAEEYLDKAYTMRQEPDVYGKQPHHFKLAEMEESLVALNLAKGAPDQARGHANKAYAIYSATPATQLKARDFAERASAWGITLDIPSARLHDGAASPSSSGAASHPDESTHGR